MNLQSDASNEMVLIERIKQGERLGFDRLVSLYQQRGLNIAYNLVGNLEDSRDVLQEAFIKVYLNIEDFRGKSQFYTWFYRIVVNCALDLLRKKKKMSCVFTESHIDEEGQEKEVQIPDTRFDPAKIAQAREFQFNLDNCIANLPEKQRTCFVLKHKNGLSTSEIAQVLKCNPSTVKVHLFRAIKNLQKSLSIYNLGGA